MPLDSAQVFSIVDRITDANGAIVPFGTVEFYEAGTNTPKTVYGDADLTVVLGTVVSCDAGGYPVSGGSTKTLIYVGTDAYKVIIKDQNGATVITHDDIRGAIESPTTSPTAFPVTPVVSKAAAYTVVVGDKGKLLNVNSTGGNAQQTLLSAVTAGDGFRLGVRHVGSANTVPIVALSGQTISRSGVASQSFVLTSYGEGVWLVSDGANWHVDTYAPPLMTGGLAYFKAADRLTATPTAPAPGARYIINGTPTGAWLTLGFANKDVVEADGNGSWLRYAPGEGWLAHLVTEGVMMRYRAGAWEDLDNMTAPIASALPTATFAHTEATNTPGGTPTTGTWTKRKLNTTVQNSITGASTATDQITLPTGNYLLVASAAYYLTGSSWQRVISTTAPTKVVYGPSTFLRAHNVTAGDNDSDLNAGILTVSGFISVTAASEIFEFQYHASDGSGGTAGLGNPKNLSGISETYATITIIKIDSNQGPKGNKGDPGDIGLTGPGYAATSTTSNSIGTGSKTFTTQDGLAYLAGQRVRVANSSTAYVEGTITSYATTSLVVNVDRVIGSGTFTSWTIGVAGDAGVGALHSEANPLSSSDGVDGQTGYDTGNGQLYPAKSGGVWPAPFELGSRVDMPSGAAGIWIGTDYDSTRKAIKNRVYSSALEPVVTRLARGAFETGAVSSGADGWLSTGYTVTEKYAAGRDGVAATTRILSTSAGSGSVRYRNTIPLPAGTYCMVIDVKSNTGSNQDFTMSRDGMSTSVTKTATTTMQQFIHEFTLSSTTSVDLRFCQPATSFVLDCVIDKAFLWIGNTASVPADLPHYGHMLLGLHSQDTVTVTNGAFDLTGGKCGFAEFGSFLTGSEMTMFAVVKRTGAYNHVVGYRQPFLNAAVESNTGGYWSLGEFEAESYLRSSFGGIQAGNATNYHRNFVGDEYYVFSARADALGVDVWIDDVCVNATYGTPASTSARLFAINNGNTTLGSKHLWAAGAIYTRALTDAERRLAIKTLKRQVQSGGLTVTQPRNYLVALGDSITVGPANNSYVQQYLANASQTVFTRNEAMGGSTIATNPVAQLNLSTRFPWVTSSIPRIEKDVYRRRHIATILIGANDLIAYSSADNFLAELGSLCDQLRTRGYIVGVCTILPKGTAISGYATHNTVRAAVNTRLRLWKGWRADFVVDFAANTTVGDDADANDTTYYSDGLHPTAAGHTVLEGIYRAAVNPWLLAP